eukprot:gnl/MRDRNA2_/MRDRNA2_123125_c0_seq1.p1 gnl/MRDRNA2_/MRDRNA2_123125_c0~~gnl/MRDRNA2_/MRDRNA2_123125_c0_seq1.p1  ORF type:complete len:1123 (+),score=198.13 gnl/MRDRNA2_/MRDRNA2_123125_c0_seq1:27-3371(+)
MPPVMFAVITLVGKDQFTPSYYMVRFGWVRFLRLYGIMPVLERIFHTVSRATLEIISIAVALCAVVFAFAGAVFTEDSPAHDGAFVSFFDYVYYAVITIKAGPPWNFERTGDMGVPWTRVFSVISIFIAMTLVPFKIGHITRLLQEPTTSVGNMTAVVNSPTGFILLAGCCTASQLEVWAEYFSSFRSPGAPKCLAYLHGGVEPISSFEKVRLQLLHQCGIQLAVIQGDCATKAEATLGTLNCADAAATVIFAELSTSSSEEVKSDRMAVIRLLAVQKFLPDMENVSAVFNQNSAKLLALDLGVRSVLVINELRMKLLAKSSVECPGLATLIANLYHLVPSAAAKNMRKSLWRHGLRPMNYIPTFDASGNCLHSEATAADEYVRGATHSVYQLTAPRCMEGEDFLEVVKMMQFRFSALLIGIRDSEHNLRLNPGPGFCIDPGDELVVLLSSSSQVCEIRECKEMRQIWNYQDSTPPTQASGGGGMEMSHTKSEAAFVNIAQKHKEEIINEASKPRKNSKRSQQRELLLSKPYSDIITSSVNGDTFINSGATKKTAAKSTVRKDGPSLRNSDEESDHGNTHEESSEESDDETKTFHTVSARAKNQKAESDLWQHLNRNGHQLGEKKLKSKRVSIATDSLDKDDKKDVKAKKPSILLPPSSTNGSMNSHGSTGTAKSVAETPETTTMRIPRAPGQKPNVRQTFRTSVCASTFASAIAKGSFRNMLPNFGKEKEPERRKTRAQSVVITSAFKYYEAKEKKVRVNDFEEAQRDLWGNILPKPGDGEPDSPDSQVARGFLLICGWPRNLFGFLRTALRDQWGAQKCIILSPTVPSHTPLESLAEFWPSVLYVKGSALQRFDLARAGLYQACAVIVFAEPQAEEAFAKPQATKYSSDIEAVLAVSKIRAMRDVHLVVELRDPLRNLCLLDSSSWTPSSNTFADLRYLDCPEYVAGSVWTDEALYSFASSEITPQLLSQYVVPASELAEHFVDGGVDCNGGRPISSCCRLIHVPESWADKRYQVMFLRLLKWGIVAIGLYRQIETTSGKRRYVVTSPAADTMLREDDQVYVLPPTSDLNKDEKRYQQDQPENTKREDGGDQDKQEDSQSESEGSETEHVEV